MNVVMTIAGSDSGGGAGIQADLKTFQELGVFGTSAITALTAQNTRGVAGIFPVSEEFVAEQMEAVFADFQIKVVKTGMLFSPEIIETVANALINKKIDLIIDPVMIAKGGASLLKPEATKAMITDLLPLATVITPNIPEAEVISGIKINSEASINEAARKILAMGTQAVVIKGGHLDGAFAEDRVFFKDGTGFSMSAPRIKTKQTHGTGCTFSASLTAFMGQGMDLKEAIIEAKRFIQFAIENPLNLGHGHGPTNHFAYKEAKGLSTNVKVMSLEGAKSES